MFSQLFPQDSYNMFLCMQAEEARQCFDSLPSTAISLQLATYYYALELCAHLKPESQPSKKHMYMYDPVELTQKILRHIKVSKELLLGIIFSEDFKSGCGIH